MVKSQQDGPQKNKTHKTLRDKLRKKREDIKVHKKEKRQKHKQYDVEQQKKKFFSKKNHKKRQDGIKQYKLYKHIERFVDIYEDDVEDFYDLFKILDEGGLIDIGDVESPKMQKCLKKIFKYLPISKKKLQYKKKQTATSKLEPLLKELVSKVIQNYLENGTDDEMKAQSSSQDEKVTKKAQNQTVKVQESEGEVKRQDKIVKKDEGLDQMASIKLYSHLIVEEEQCASGPFIPAEQRQKLAEMFEQQLKNGVPEEYEKRQKQIIQEEQNHHFERIFGMSTGKNKGKKANIDEIPDELLCQGSAKIGQRQEIDPNQIQQYDKIHRPRKLIEEHQEMKKLGKYADERRKNERVPFDRQRDVVNGGKVGRMMNNGVFFDFKDRMTKGKTTNKFL